MQLWEDRATYNVASSVGVCSGNTRSIEVHTDHQPLMFAWVAGRGRVAAYNDSKVSFFLGGD
ncbi:Hypothetical protein, putative [Bodo saltans]|uniref:Uncharacterized protein n=1 Tax=Bodo saltans TaxID=75058 RepID=A0A0S4JBL5_BODSA|nr:Hypothetical protein, putative [Bodo saltans]|eukprot:CUG86555.1 Hypothetical protein, putative [Bodo saltans]